ncbi:hypothetical protein KP509_18G067800 [Ceratopteris richardii]|uniref:PPPDE domain-containing protein n=1 Tax=Ceratopteris richardii TaxID=49495 RepID=A0A8T2SUC4_CERRI|nr:hypothetical protein KP509_18G067800 [Ceratopteris richardii]
MAVVSSSAHVEAMQRSSSSFRTAIYLNIYDLTTLNNYLYWFGLGIFHSAIEINGIEYAYGAHDMPTSGIFQVEPRSCPGFLFRRSILLGTTDLSPMEIYDVMEDLASQYTGDAYNLLTKNCNHFSNDLCMRLTKKPSPGWVNRLANLGVFCSCVLPESLQVTMVQQPLEYHSSEDLQSLDNSDEDVLLLAPARGN